MKRFILILAVCLLFTQNILSQETSFAEKRIGFHVMPLSLIDTYSRFRFGVDYDNGKSLGFSLDYGIGGSSIIQVSVTDSDGDVEYREYTVFELRPEVKFYLNRKKRSDWYLATEMFYIVKERIYEDDHYYEEDSNDAIKYNTAKLNVKKMGLHFKVGVEMVAGGIIKFDLYWGLGIAARDKYYSDVTNFDDNNEYSDDHNSWSNAYRNEGKTIMPHLTAGAKIGVILFKQKYE